ncbi:immunity 26/phosphotriesterase HocA family protein [Comamonas odontotermitis]|uniref:immunity 26/phosphotriesterase HocA family protein n=1 Tax=Comamonas odontotermitis TaxID=379895 RepID=UPI001CC4261B|nr:immunity 26/phosphotriesterase HocA family protein [Comamonas odontotermitis]UBB18381.1 immunity 26/phosphotriesterase HocA family protein [Comamonas odontotermitis]
MEKPFFELTNEQRRYLGLDPIEKGWELVKLFDSYVYFDGDIIRKEITSSENSYTERNLKETTTENRTILLPKTEKGKPKKLNFTATQTFKGIGVYFSFSESFLTISNYTTQTEYHSERFTNKNIEYLKLWLKEWIADSSKDDLQDIEKFRTANRTHCKYKEGDFFAFKIERRKWGFGRILFDVQKNIKTKKIQRNEHYGLTNLMGKCLVVKVYHKTSNSINVDLDELSRTMALPSQFIMDNHFYYGENLIIGHKPLTTDELDMPISYSQSINSDDRNKVYIQHGLIYKELDISKFNKYLTHEDESLYNGHLENPYRKESSGFGLNINTLQSCITEKSNQPYWTCTTECYDRKFDLRNPENQKIKIEIFKAFDLDPDKSNTENLNQ